MVKEIGNTKIHSLCMVLHPMGARIELLEDYFMVYSITNKEKFIIGISKVKDEVVREGIDKYIKEEWFKKGYDFPYLGKVIRNLSISKVMKKDKEEKRIGNNPPEL